MHEAVLGIEQPGAYADATAGTDTTVELWCNDHCDLLHVSGGSGGSEGAATGAEAVVAHVEDAVGIRERIVEDDERLLITDACLKEQDDRGRRDGQNEERSGHGDDTIEAILAEHDCLLVPPLRYADGAKWCRVLALAPENLTAFYRDVAAEFSVTVESKREVGSVTGDRPLLTLDSALPDLSVRQREAFELAMEMGYYEIPRETTTAEIAGEMGVERRTCEEHLRRAENKLLGVLANRTEY
ncbi:helix-turn-helix domain-containing protein [Halorussus halophilus]|uniref:helix-turn-helix domain-containing protein n=1 Tax=Halorussus halophilus TaxID=2650975 RepID=UPI0013018EDC|nr:helix-turn-helix domain-containing protein [Halorussus halophilus]